MATVKSLLKYFILIIFLPGVLGCEKPPGPGGTAKVSGRVFAYDFDNTQRYLIGKGYSAGERVYISYGTGAAGNDLKTAVDGSFEFLYLNKGHYKIYVNSLDTSIKFKGNDMTVPVVKEFDITEKKQTIDLGDFFINK